MAKKRLSRTERANLIPVSLMITAVDDDPPDLDLARRAIGMGLDVNYTDPDDPTRESFLMRAAEFGAFEVVRLLVEAGAEREARDAEGRTALDRAVDGGHDEVAAYLRGPSTPRWSGRPDRAPPPVGLQMRLKPAILAGDVEEVRRLIEAGVDVNAIPPDAEDELLATPPLCSAAGVGNLEIVRALVRAGADPRSLDPDGEPPAAIARGCGHHAVAAFLEQDEAKRSAQPDGERGGRNA